MIAANTKSDYKYQFDIDIAVETLEIGSGKVFDRNGIGSWVPNN